MGNELFSSGQDQLSFQTNDIIENIKEWICIEVGEGTPVYDNLSVYMVRAFTTLLDSFIRQHRITESDKLTIVAHINKTMNESLRLLDDSRDGRYTDFCSFFFGASDGKEARDILEALSADSQCNAVIGEYDIGKTRCWICNLKLSGNTKPQCEHILPIIDALFYLNLYQYTKSFPYLSHAQQAILILEYLWSEKCCNETKNNDQWLAFDESGRCNINRHAIEASMRRIAEAAENPNGGRECWEHLREYEDGDIKANVAGKANIDRIRRELQPIVDTINSIVEYIERHIDQRLQTNKPRSDEPKAKRAKTVKQAIRAITVFKYLTLIRFLSNLSGSKMVEAFMGNIVNTNVQLKQERRRQLNAAREEERAKERAEIEQRKEQREASRKVRQAEEESIKKSRRIAQLEGQIRQFEDDLRTHQRLLHVAQTERGQHAQARQIQRVQSSIQSLQEELDALRALSGGQRGGSYETRILPDFETEKHYIMLLSYYPIYINENNKGNPLSEEEYMSEPEILNRAMTYFRPIKTELIDLQPQTLATVPSPISVKPTNYFPAYVLPVSAAQAVLPASAAMATLPANMIPSTRRSRSRNRSRRHSRSRSRSRNRSRNRSRSRSRSHSPKHFSRTPTTPVKGATPVEMSFGGQTRKRRVKRITRKKYNH